MKLLPRAWVFLLATLIYVAPIRPAVQSTAQRLQSGSTAEPVVWPAGPPRDSLPAWARNGTVRFARWDGGRIETAKAILSGWPNFWPPDPNVLYATDNWYDLRTIQLLKDAGVNMIWVTFSNGFSNQTERLNQEQLRRYISECHRQGIHVMAYESITNMIWQDMFKNVPESRNWTAIGKDGKPVPYGAAAYKKVGYISRYMANLSSPEWQDYLRKRVDLALDAGADGVDYDNNFTRNITQLMGIYEMIYKYGSRQKKDFLLMGNFHSSSYVVNRLTNSMTTEDGVEPGIYDASHLRRVSDRQKLLAAANGYLMTNGGLFRALDALSEGWKPNLVEDGRREFGQRETKPMTPERRQLAMAEAMSFGAADELFVEDALAAGLWNHKSDAVALWQAIAQYNRFFAAHEAYYTGTRSTAPVAVVLDDSSRGVDLLNALAARNTLFDVLYARDLKSGRLSRYSKVALLTADTVSDKSLGVLEDYVRNGGRLLVADQSASLDEDGHKRQRPSFFGHKLGKGKCVYLDTVPALDELAEQLHSSKVPGITAPAGVLYNVVAQPARHRLVVHLLNYRPVPVKNVNIDLNRNYRSATLISPDDAREAPVAIRQEPSGSDQVNVPSLKIYSMTVLNQ